MEKKINISIRYINAIIKVIETGDYSLLTSEDMLVLMMLLGKELNTQIIEKNRDNIIKYLSTINSRSNDFAINGLMVTGIQKFFSRMENIKGILGNDIVLCKALPLLSTGNMSILNSRIDSMDIMVEALCNASMIQEIMIPLEAGQKFVYKGYKSNEVLKHRLVSRSKFNTVYFLKIDLYDYYISDSGVYSIANEVFHKAYNSVDEFITKLEV